MTDLSHARRVYEAVAQLEAEAVVEWQHEPRREDGTVSAAYIGMMIARHARLRAQEVFNEMLAQQAVQDEIGSAD